MNKRIYIEIASLLLIILFVYTAVSKLIAFADFLFVLRQTRELKPFAEILSILLPASELFASVLLLTKRYRKKGLYISFGIMLAFTLYVSYLNTLAKHRPCACGGVMRGLTWPQHLIFNSVFTLIALTGILFYHSVQKHQPSIQSTVRYN